MNLDTANETDVREDVAMPILTALGYARSTANDILREVSLKYSRQSLGRKKPTDPPLRGIPDYTLVVTGAGRWVLEVKAPNVEISRDEIEQAISYARHPEVAATYAALLNGRRFVVFHYTQASDEEPLLDFEVESPESAANKLMGLLSPASIRRDCTPSPVDTDLPLAEGLRSSATVAGGLVEYSGFSWESNVQLPAQASSPLDSLGAIFREMRTEITGGRVWREIDRIKATLTWAMPHKDMMQFALDKRLLEVEYVALSQSLSADPENPTVFDVVGDVMIEAGERVFDISRFQSELAGAATNMTYKGQAVGFVEDFVFAGAFRADYLCTYPAAPGIEVYLYVDGRFEVRIDDR